MDLGESETLPSKGLVFVFCNLEYSGIIINVRKRSCGKVMFLRLSVILFKGRGDVHSPG